jgi:hypothetical protein
LELVVEGSLGRAGVTDDVGDGGGAVSALGYRGREAVEQAASKRIDIDRLIDGLSGSRIVSDGFRHVASRWIEAGSALASTWYHRVP